MFDDSRGQILFSIILSLLVLVFGVWYGVAHYEECRRFHPAWYCLGSQ